MYKPPKNFDFPETDRFFRFVWFEEFPWVCYSRWEGGGYCLPCILFRHKDVGSSGLENIYKKTISNMTNSSKNIKKTSIFSNGETQKESNITY